MLPKNPQEGNRRAAELPAARSGPSRTPARAGAGGGTSPRLVAPGAIFYHSSMLPLLLVLVTSTVPPDTARADAPTLLRRVIEGQEEQHWAQRALTFRERTVKRDLRKDGTVSETESATFVVTPTTGGEYRRLVAKNGTPLSTEDEAKEKRKLEEHTEEQLRLTPEERERETLEKLEERVERYQKRLKEALEAYDFEPLPDDVLDGQRVRVFRFTPKDGYRGHSRWTKILARMEGTVWIDARRDQLTKLSVEFTEDLNFLGGVFGRVSKGTRATVVGTLRDELWVLDNVDAELNARLYFFKRYRQHITVDYDDYRRYQVDAQETLVPTATSQR